MPNESDEEIPIALYNPISGLRTDIDNLMDRFSKTESVRFDEFSKVWKGMKFSLIFAGRQDDRECREFLEYASASAVCYWMPPYSFQIRIGALYLLYGLFLKQPISPKAKIRVTHKQWGDIIQFVEELREQSHLDAEYIFHKLCYLRAFSFVATGLEEELQSKEKSIDKAIKHSGGASEGLVNRNSVLVEVLEDGQMEQLQDIHNQYHEMKIAMEGQAAKHPPPAVDMIQTDLVSYLRKAVHNHVEWRKNVGTKKSSRRRTSSASTSESEQEFDNINLHFYEGEDSIGQRRAELKAVAFGRAGTASRGRRHRQAKVTKTAAQGGKAKKKRAGESSELSCDTDGSPISKRKRSKRSSVSGSTSESTHILSPPRHVARISHVEAASSDTGELVAASGVPVVPVISKLERTDTFGLEFPSSFEPSADAAIVAHSTEVLDQLLIDEGDMSRKLTKRKRKKEHMSNSDASVSEEFVPKIKRKGKQKISENTSVNSVSSPDTTCGIDSTLSSTADTSEDTTTKKKIKKKKKQHVSCSDASISEDCATNSKKKRETKNV